MRALFFILCLFVLTPAFSQPGYRLDFKIKGWKDTTVYLGFYYGESTRVRDTAHVNGKGEFFFDGKKNLEQGIYFLIMNKFSMVNFVVGRDQDFRMESDTADLVKHMKVTGDEDNKLFFENQLFIADRHKEVDPWMKILQDTTLKEDKKKEARAEFAKVNEKVVAYQDAIILHHPETVTARVFKSGKQVEVPPAPKKANGTIDSTFQLRWYREHYFDNFDLADDALLRMPKSPYQEKVKEYLATLYVPQPDSVFKGIEFMAAKAKKNPATYNYLVYTCSFLYQAPDIMGLDQVFVKVYDKYFATGEMDYWANAQMKKNFKELAEKIGHAQINTTAPNLMMQDVNLQPRSLYDIKKKYTIVYFFDPDCGHCRAETPKLVEFYNGNKVKYDLEVFAVASDTSIQKVKSFIKEFKTPWITVDGPRTYMPVPYNKLYYTESFPAVYILDDKKKVIARKLPVDKIDAFLTNYEKFRKSKRSATDNKGM